MQTKISIITATKNSIETLHNSLNSIRSQSYKNIEHIIIDNKSTDGTVELLKDYKSTSKIHNVKLISEKDLGIYDAINKGILMSAGKYICILNSDDIFNSNNTIENIVKKIEFEKDIEIFLFSLVFLEFEK